jgi:hydrogenase maturation factor
MEIGLHSLRVTR